MADDALAAPGSVATLDGDWRTRLLDLPAGLVEDVSTARVPPAGAAEGFSPDFQVVLPYRGALVWHVGGDDVIGDPNRVLFVSGGESYRVSQALPGGY